MRLILLLFALLCASHCTEVNRSSGEPGKELVMLKSLGIGSCMDAEVHGDILYVIGSSSLFSFDITSPEEPVLLDKLTGLGNVRQIEVQEGYAYVTAREEGLFVINVANPRKMVLSTHYDTLELGTGIAVSGTLAAVANRQYGVEFVDISDPENPLFLGMVRTGEAQSVFIQDTLAVIGDWATREVVICNVSNPREPRVLSKVELDGYGDGVFVKGNLCFAATGHHARGYRQESNDSTFFGKGHGLEIIDLSDPSNPVKLSVLKLPVSFHQRYADMWDVQVSGNYAFIGDSEAGLYIADVSDPQNPFFVASATLPLTELPDYMMESKFKGGKKSGPVCGFAIGKGVVYLAGRMNDLFIAEAKPFAEPVEIAPGIKRSFPDSGKGNQKSPSVYCPGSQVHSMFLTDGGNKALIAAGDGGVHEVQLSPVIKGKTVLKTGSIVFDLCYQNGVLFLAEGNEGFSIWEYEGAAEPRLISRYKPSSGGIYQLRIATDRHSAFLHAGASTLEMIDISDLKNPKKIYQDQQLGLMYRLPIAAGFLDGRYLACNWHATGCYFYDLKGEGGIMPVGMVFPKLGVINGAAFMKDKAVAISGGGIVIQNPPGKPQTALGEPLRIEGISLSGKPTIFGDRMYVANRMKGTVTALDIGDLKKPVKVWQLALTGNPGLVTENRDMVIIPDGHGGLELFKRSDGTPYYGNFPERGNNLNLRNH